MPPILSTSLPRWLTCVLSAAGRIVQARHPAAATTPIAVAVTVASPLLLKFDHPLCKRFKALLKPRNVVGEVGSEGLEMMIHRGRVVCVNSDWPDVWQALKACVVAEIHVDEGPFCAGWVIRHVTTPKIQSPRF
ncbi:hypothetical protein LX32DRAFT_645352 [Colletotrichum zoysiae]|uniref:Uncharacterized protein n=1 Tax=Colletotrichum zoysiae TaxID=1216348 RepID=A0AAD9H686_9PEZI|nr:hypothetical protein LX32DRAFT_645352 [Colletotrichum zoysiae]